MPEPIKTALSLAAALLFLWSAVWCIRRVFSPEPAPHYTEPSSRSRCWAAIAGTAFILVLHLIFAVTAHINYPEADFRQAIEWQFYGNTDPRHYLDLSIYGYGTQEAFPEQYLQIVFFPLYPALLHILHFVTRLLAGFCSAVAALCSGHSILLHSNRPPLGRADSRIVAGASIGQPGVRVFCSAHDREFVPAAYGAVCADAGT